MAQSYKRPPITEAVIEIRFGTTTIEQERLGKVASRLEETYPLKEEENLMKVQVAGAKADLIITPFGFKLSSLDQADVVQLRPSALALSRRAPYLGWDVFEPAFFNVWDALKRTVGALSLTRIGVRYINRIDVPEVPVNPADYIRLFPEVPDGFPAPSMRQSGHVASPLSDIKCNVVVNASTVEAPLIGHSSLQLDIDVSRTVDLPGRSEDIRSVIASMRVAKNSMFELLVSNKARELFSK